MGRARGGDAMTLSFVPQVLAFFVAIEFVADPLVTKSAVSGGEIMEWRTDGRTVKRDPASE